MTQTPSISPALSALLDIMTSSEVPEARCIEAARAIIEYEAPAEVFAITHDYLMGVARDLSQPVALKLRALELVRKVEAKRVVAGTARATDLSRGTTLGRKLAVAKRRLELFQRGEWPPNGDWAKDLGAVEVLQLAKDGIADRLETARMRKF